MSRNARYALAGLQAGISGGIGMLLWLSVASRIFGKNIWWPENVLASAFYGDAAMNLTFGRYTLAGASLALFVWGLLGILFGILWRDRPGGLPLRLAALTVAMAAYYGLFKGVWRHFSPLGAIYAPDRQILIGHLLLGFLLARYRVFRDRLTREAGH